MPQFKETSNEELNTLFTTMREKYLIPGYLSRPQQRLIFGGYSAIHGGFKSKQMLEDNPQTVEIGGEEIQLKWIDRTKGLPRRKRLVKDIVNLVEQVNEGEAWANLPALLTAMKHTNGPPCPQDMERIVRKAMLCGRVGTVLQCLNQAQHTGMSLAREEVLENVIWGLHDLAQREGWSEPATRKALRDANQVALLLESEEHGSGHFLRQNDPRRRPEVLGTFLELAAVYAYKHQGAQDADGKVKAYTQRLMDCIKDSGAAQPKSFAPAANGRVKEMLNGVPIWHGLRLAQKILGRDMPQAGEAAKIVADYEAGLRNLAQALEAKDPKEGGYGDQALRVWRECIRD